MLTSSPRSPVPAGEPGARLTALSGPRQFLGVRSTWLSIGVLAAIGALTWGLGDAALPSLAQPLSPTVSAPSPVLVAAPMACATVIVLSLAGSMAPLERLAAVDLTGYRIGHLMLLLSICVLTLLPAIYRSTWAGSGAVTIENLLGSTAVVLVLAALEQAEMSWLVLFPYGMLGLLVSPVLPPSAQRAFIINSTTDGIQLGINTALLLGASAYFLVLARPR